MQKINFYLQQFLIYQNLKILQSDWTRAFFHLTREPDFFQTCGFNRIIKVIVVHDLNAKILHISGVFFFFFFVKSKKTYLWRRPFGHYLKNEIFSQKSVSVSFLSLRHPNFMKSFRKILRAVLEKTRLPTDILTVMKS